MPGIVASRLLLTAGLRRTELAPDHSLGEELETFWRASEDAEIPVMVLVTDHLDQIGTIAATHPKLKLVIDHCAGVPNATTPRESFVHLPRLLELARLPNVYVKLSGLPSHSEKPSPYPDLDPIVHRVVDAFGANRCMFGSDVTRFHGEKLLSEIVDQFRVGCPFLTREQREEILGLTAARVFGLAKPHGDTPVESQ